MIASSRFRSAGDKVIEIPVRIAQNRTRGRREESRPLARSVFRQTIPHEDFADLRAEIVDQADRFEER
jgi:hypothetical protein